MSVVVSMRGRKSGEISESERSIVANTSGAVRSATAYQRAPTFHLVILLRRSRKPAFPWRRPVNTMPAMGGPATHASIGYPPGPPAPMIRSMPPQEIANVRAKKLSRGWLLRKALMVAMSLTSYVWLEIPLVSVCY
jgi:hypothetical protein